LPAIRITVSTLQPDPYLEWLDTPKSLSGYALAEARGLVRLRNPEGPSARGRDLLATETSARRAAQLTTPPVRAISALAEAVAATRAGTIRKRLSVLG